MIQRSPPHHHVTPYLTLSPTSGTAPFWSQAEARVPNFTGHVTLSDKCIPPLVKHTPQLPLISLHTHIPNGLMPFSPSCPSPFSLHMPLERTEWCTQGPFFLITVWHTVVIMHLSACWGRKVATFVLLTVRIGGLRITIRMSHISFYFSFPYPPMRLWVQKGRICIPPNTWLQNTSMTPNWKLLRTSLRTLAQDCWHLSYALHWWKCQAGWDFIRGLLCTIKSDRQKPESYLNQCNFYCIVWYFDC